MYGVCVCMCMCALKCVCVWEERGGEKDGKSMKIRRKSIKKKTVFNKKSIKLTKTNK